MKSKATGRSFHSTFIYNKGKLLSIGTNNLKKLHRRNIFGPYKGCKDNPEKYIASIHSEIDAILKLGDSDFFKYVFINVRIDRNGRVNMAKPCPNCLNVLKMIGYKRLYYTTADGGVEELI
jgi:hypothetical protein